MRVFVEKHATLPPPPPASNFTLPSFKDEMRSRLVLQVLGSLCQFECTYNQTLVRDQGTPSSINLVAETMDYVVSLYRSMDATTVPMVLAALQTLRHFAQGNCVNQREMLARRLLVPINHLLHQMVCGDTQCPLKFAYLLQCNFNVLCTKWYAVLIYCNAILRYLASCIKRHLLSMQVRMYLAC